MKTKTCSVCHETKPLSEFYTTRPRKDGTLGYRADCKECVKKRSKKWWKEHPARRKKTSLAYYHRTRLEVLLHYSGDSLECACCGENHIEFLTIDHIDGDGAEHRREVGRTRTLFQWLKTNGYPPGFQVLCYNCNCAKGSDGICPHELERQDQYDPVDVDAVMNPERPYTSRNRLITHEGKTQSLKEWAEEAGISRSAIALRLDRYGWSVHDALTKPTRKQKSPVVREWDAVLTDEEIAILSDDSEPSTIRPDAYWPLNH